jgi:crotonobetainyl-CoA:carnitine CoA-transferase CaiB-like acyl-CoA transferase
MRSDQADPQIVARGLRIDLPHALAGHVPLVGNPIRMSGTPPAYDRAPPRLGEHTATVLRELVGCSETELQALGRSGVI